MASACAAPSSRVPIDRQLERALRAYQREQLTRQTIGLVIKMVSLVLLVARVFVVAGVLPNPAAGWLGTPWSLSLFLGASGVAICRSIALSSRKVHVLDKLRAELAIERVRRDVTRIPIGIGRFSVTSTVPTVFVDFADGTSLPVISFRGPEPLDRLEALLRRQVCAMPIENRAV